MFHRGNNGHKFSDILRKHARGGPREAEPSDSGTRNVGEHPAGAPRAKPTKNPGGAPVTVGNARAIPSATPSMSGHAHPVPRGGGSSQLRRGIASSVRTPKPLPEHVLLGNHGQPAGHMTKGSDEPFGGRENPRERRALPGNMQGKFGVRGKAKRGGKPRFNIGDAHHNTGSPKIGRARTVKARDLAGYL